MTKKEHTLLVVEPSGQIVANIVVNQLLNELDKQKEAVAKQEQAIREALLTEMIKHNVMSVKTGEYTISQIVPKTIHKFDVDRFLLEENEDILSAFTTVTETTTFDEARFAKDHPNLYMKYQVSHYDTNVDIAKLQSVFADKYEKYSTVEESTKPVSLRIAASRRK